MGTLNYQNAGEARKEIVRSWRQKWSGPNRHDIWSELAREMGGRIEQSDTDERVCERVTVVVSPCWQIVLDLQVMGRRKRTRMRCPFVSRDPLRFRIYRRSIFGVLVKKLSMQDIDVGDQSFHTRFTVKSSQPDRVRELLRNQAHSETDRVLPRIDLRVVDNEGWFGAKFPDRVDELVFSVPAEIMDLHLLKSCFALFVETLQELTRMGIAEISATNVRL